jgi:nucleotide-binding universal stress UspA family protein
MLPKTILVATDLSDVSDPALQYACDLAAKLDGKIALVNVIGLPTMGIAEIGLAVTNATIEAQVHDNEEALERIAEDARARCSVGPVLLKTGDASDMIGEAARETGADLIVMGTHGRTGVSRLLLGSVAEKVMRTAPCPVLTIRAPD